MEVFIKNNLTVVPHPSYFPLFLRLKIKVKGCQFDTIEVIEAESQAVLNTPTPSQNTTSRMHLKDGRSARNGAYGWNEIISEMMVGSRPKVSLTRWQNQSLKLWKALFIAKSFET
jgi:hypothetical protein